MERKDTGERNTARQQSDATSHPSYEGPVRGERGGWPYGDWVLTQTPLTPYCATEHVVSPSRRICCSMASAGWAVALCRRVSAETVMEEARSWEKGMLQGMRVGHWHDLGARLHH